MLGSDVFTTGFRDMGYLHDRVLITEYAEPAIDPSQDVELISAREDKDFTIVRVKRPLRATDAQDLSIQPGPVHIIWAYAALDAPTGRIWFHPRWGSQLVEFIPLAKPSPTPAVVGTGRRASTRPNLSRLLPPLPHQIKLHDMYLLSWGYDNTTITFEMQVNTLGWVGIGVSPDGKMPGSDMFVGWIVRGKPEYQDRHATERAQPKIDTRQDWEVLHAREAGNFTIFRVRRPRLLTGDEDLPIRPGKTHMVFSFERSDGHEDEIQYHSIYRGSVEVVLIPDRDLSLPLPPLPNQEDLHDMYHLSWSHDATTITFELRVVTKGWIGFGISPDGHMPGSDMFVGWITGDGVAEYQDRHATGHVQPEIDSRQDWEVLHARETGNVTVFRVRRPLVLSGDEDLSITPGLTHVVFAFEHADGHLDEIQYHSIYRGSRQLELIPAGRRGLPPVDVTIRPSVAAPPGLPTRPQRPAPLPNRVVLQGDGNYTLFWMYNANDRSVTLEMHVRTRGWVGIGISPNGRMIGSDMFTGWIENNSPVYQDRIATQYDEPKIDARQDWELLYSEEDSQHTIFRIKRPLTLNGPEDLSITPGPVHVVWAYNQQDGHLNSIQYHATNRGTQQVEFIPGSRRQGSVGPAGPLTVAPSRREHPTRPRPPTVAPTRPPTRPPRPGPLPNEVVLQDGDRYTLSWMHDADDRSVTLEMRVRTRGWVGIGISPDGSMVNSDMFTGWISNNAPVFQDRFATQRAEPEVDARQDWQLVYAEENSQYTIFRVKRPLDLSGDDDRTITPGQNYIVWAYNPQDGQNGRIQYHGANRGIRLVEIVPAPPSPPTRPPAPAPRSLCGLGAATENYPHQKMLSPNYCLFWHSDGIQVTFEAIVQTRGWIGFGISPSRLMVGADIFTGWVKGGQVVSQDRFASARQEPEIDPQRDWEILSGDEIDGSKTRIKFRRNLQAAEAGVDLPIRVGPVNIIWAFGSAEPEGLLDTQIFYHGNNRGSDTINIRQDN